MLSKLISSPLFLSFLDSINDGILVADNNAIIKFVNYKYLQIVEMSSEELIDKSLEEVRPGALLPSIIRTGKRMTGVFREVGSSRYVVDMSPVKHKDKIIGGISIVKDIAQVRKLAKALDETQKSLQTLKSTVDSYFQSKYRLDQLQSASPKYCKVLNMSEKAALANANVLITGESGTGKELIAQGIHSAGTRQQGPFVPINCAAIPDILLESELFGYGDGAFTGARKGGKIGLFQLADKGTLFLDEIGDMHIDMQAKLLRVLQEQRFRRVGELNEIKVDVRIIAATNQDIEAMVSRGRFRQDLYYRLNVFQLNVPTLRERQEDIIDLAYFLAEDYAETIKIKISDEVKTVFRKYDWPGNIRELKNVIEFACNMTDMDGIIRTEHLPERIRLSSMGELLPTDSMQPLRVSVKEFERRLIKDLILKCGDSMKAKKQLAETLEISLASLYRKISN